MAAKKKPAIQLQPTGIIDDVIYPAAKKILRKVAQRQVQRASKEIMEGSAKAASTLSKSTKNSARANAIVKKQMTSYKNKEAKGVVKKVTNYKSGVQKVVKNSQKQQKLMSSERGKAMEFELQKIFSSPIKKSNKAAASRQYRVRSRKELRGK